MTIFRQKQSGFTLVEVLVAITILLMVIVGPMKIISRSINSTTFASQEVNAWFLAQEGLELAQKGRDDLVLQKFQTVTKTPFTDFTNLSGTYGPCFNSKGCDLTITNKTTPAIITVTDCSLANTPCALVLDTAGLRAKYLHVANLSTLSSTQTVSPFTRVITMSTVNGADGLVREVNATSTVTWRTGSLIAGQKVAVTTYLFNIYDTN